MSKFNFVFLSMVLSFFVFFAGAQAKESKYSSIKKIHAKELKEWIDSGKKFELIDARPKKFEKGDVIVGARFLPYDADDQKISATLPSKDATIVVYCASTECPASTYLAKQLVKMGYKNIYKYPEGIDDWSEKEFPIGKPKT